MPERKSPEPIIIDTDPGHDDAFAILLALASPELSVLAITVAGGNVGLARTLPNALALTALAGSNVPVHAGADRPLLGRFTSEPRVHGEDGLGGVVLPPGGNPAAELAADAIRRILRDAASQGRSLLLSIHQLTEAQRVCDRFVLLSAGHVAGEGTLAELLAQAKLEQAELEDVRPINQSRLLGAG